jgi:two-component system sensor histidine kinase UhpB
MKWGRMKWNLESIRPRASGRTGEQRAAARVRLVYFIGVCFLLQGLYWGLLRPILTAPRGDFDSIAVADASVAVLSAPDDAAVAAADFHAQELPFDECCDAAGYRAVRMHFRLIHVPSEGLGIYPFVGADNYRLSVNGSIIYSEGRLTTDGITYDGNVRRVFRVPQGVLKAGDNTIEFVLSRDPAIPQFSLAPPLLGNYAKLQSALAGRLFWLNDWFTVSITIGVAISLFSLIVLWRSRQRAEVLWAFLLIAGWTAKLAYYQWTDPPVSGETRLLLLYAFVNFIPVAWFNFANVGNVAWRRPLMVASLLSYATTLGVNAAILHWDIWDGADTIDRVSMLYSAVLAITAIGAFSVSLFRRREGHVWQHAFFLLCLSLIVVDSIAEIMLADFGHNVNTSMPFLIVGFVAAFLAGNVRLFQSSAQLNTLLSQQLSERTAELEQAHRREQGLVRIRAHHEERRRILRDMHDGLGSQLMSMLLAARRGEAKPEAVADGLQSVVDEMRLMVDSMDSVGESLLAALTLFRDRVAPRVEAAGFQFDWKNGFGDEFPDYGPRPTLQIFRILQEAVVNAMKHSGGKVISVVVGSQPAHPRLPRISVIDNGTGIADGAGRGRGLSNMRSRAKSFGATIDWVATGTGTEVVLDLPAPPELEISP